VILPDETHRPKQTSGLDRAAFSGKNRIMQEHWERVYGAKAAEQVSWFRPHLETSFDLIKRASRGNRSNWIIDVGGGASTLVDDLIGQGYRNVTVLDISQAALDAAQRRLGATQSVRWLRADVTEAWPLPTKSFDIWHDRAVFHFLTTSEDRLAYVRNVISAVRPGGHVIVSTFGPEGPTRCSGLEVMRYDADTLHSEFGTRFRLVESLNELHETPFGTTQQFVCGFCTLEG
jgi:SAM-dependent methyltransferase